MATIEQAARGRGAQAAHVDTYDFQAVDFYKKNGYREERLSHLRPARGLPGWPYEVLPPEADLGQQSERSPPRELFVARGEGSSTRSMPYSACTSRRRRNS